MNSLSLALIDERHLYVSGEVVVHPSAVIAPGVMLQADPGCRLVINAGVCIGQGSVLHAHQGTLAIEPGVVMGNGVLIVGKGTIGANACIGSFSTIISCSVAANQLISPRSLLGDTSRQVDLDNVDLKEDASTVTLDSEVEASIHQTNPVSEAPEPASVPEPTSDPAAPPPEKTMTQVYGQAYVERIMITMFPHRRSLNNPPSNDSQDSDSQTESPPANPPP